MAKENDGKGQSKDKGGENGNKNKITILVVVGGQPTTVEANIHAPLQTIVPEALKKTGNTGQGVENWELKDAGGNPLDTSKKIEECGFTPETRLFLSLKAGVAGD